MKKLAVFVLIFSFLSVSASEKVINLFLIGPGLVGGELLKQIDAHFSSQTPIEIRVVGLANSQFMHFDPKGISLKNWKSKLTESNNSMSLQKFVKRMADLKLSHSVFVDCTSDQRVADIYPEILRSNISIVTPNKKANSSKYSYYSELKNLSAKHRVKFLYDSNVGAGLPIIQTIKSINRSNDSVVRLEAILSGTLSYLFNTYDGTVPFSQVVRKAQQKGYTEPDPRDDLNGLDMARKFLILAREAGQPLEMDDILIQPFLSKDCFEASSVAEFYEKLSREDLELSILAENAAQQGKVLRFIGTLENGTAVLSLKAVSMNHPFYQISDTDNIASINSRIYGKNPIVIKGPGAGSSITAASVLSNIVQTME